MAKLRDSGGNVCDSSYCSSWEYPSFSKADRLYCATRVSIIEQDNKKGEVKECRENEKSRKGMETDENEGYNATTRTTKVIEAALTRDLSPGPIQIEAFAGNSVTPSFVIFFLFTLT